MFLGIPVLNRLDLLGRCLDYVDQPGEIVVVNNNSVEPAFGAGLARLAARRGFEVQNQERNLGVAASWNLLIRTAMARGHSMVVIGSNDTFLFPGSLQTVLTMDKGEAEVIWHIRGWNFFVFDTRAVERVGWFDENFYPAYDEDEDYAYRCDLAGAVRSWSELESVGAKHLGSQTIRSDAEYARLNRFTHQQWNARYYFAKWGGPPQAEVHRSPFGRPDRDWRWWPDPGLSLAERDWDQARRERGARVNR
ncbi:MAG TPA: glycosyltransferase [Thermoanaerobaculia bacterium]|nr:glycosyltransferase [Thermoanaerobaculia bacterium]